MTRTRRRTLRGRGKASVSISRGTERIEGIRNGYLRAKPAPSPAPKLTEEERLKALEKVQRDTARNHEKAREILEPLIIGRKYWFRNQNPDDRDEGSIGTLTRKDDTSVNFNINRVNYHIANPWDYTFEYAPDDSVDALSDELAAGLTLTPHLVLDKRGSSRRRRHAKPRTRGRTA